VLSAFFRGYLSGFCGYSLGDFASLADEALAKSALREIFCSSGVLACISQVFQKLGDIG
jgi:hypothetical protein